MEADKDEEDGEEGDGVPAETAHENYFISESGLQCCGETPLGI